jgi:molybdopterin-guanine dinucleotide biosynthesis protein A
VTNGYVLAGGTSSRFGRDKALAEVRGKSMLLRACELLGEVCGSVAVVAAQERYSGIGYSLIPDRWPGAGPLGGIITALLASAATAAGGQSAPAEWNLIVSCDMPFLTAQWLAFLTAHAEASSKDAIVPRSASGLEPLCACWRTSAAETLSRAFESGIRKISDAIALLPVAILDESAWKRFDTAGRLFLNMNTPADYEAVRQSGWNRET